ncbi:TPA: phage holin [Salmonella enterica subsp. enterica serovar Cotham]
MTMDKMTTGASYGVSFATTLYSILDSFTHDEWAAIGILSGVIFGALTFLTNFYFQWRRLKIQERGNSDADREKN